jgi:hypothetical protein
MGCTNCDKKSLENKKSSKVTTGNVEYDGIDFTCATDPSLDTVTTDSLNVVLLRLFNAVCQDGGCCLSTVTYSTLVSSITAGTLIPNSVYRFPYSTKHLISGTTAEYNDTSVHYDDGTGVKSTLTPDTEYLLVRAISNNKIALEAYSESYPRDIIYYDHTLDTTEDGLESRPGFITYREDPDNNVSAHFDFRNVLHRRWDMDFTVNRDTEYKAALGDDASSSYNHEIFYKTTGLAGSGGSIPPFVNYDSTGNSTLGFVTTANAGTYRDFKTFVGYDTLLWNVSTGGTEKPRFKNIHINKSEALAKVIGSASGLPITGNLTNAGVAGGAYPSLANVVIFSRSAENIKIGQNASGITITGRTNSEIEIGHNNENIIIGGTQTAPRYDVATEPKSYGFNKSIKIGHNNRNVMISDANRRLTIGDGNIGVLFNRHCYNNTIGNHNTNVYCSFNNDIVIENWCTNIKTSSSNNFKVEGQNVDLDIINAQAFPASIGYGSAGVGKNIPDGLANDIAEVEQSNNSILVKAGCNKVFLANTASATIGSKCHKLFIALCSDVVIQDGCQKLDIYNGYYISLGTNCSDTEIQNVTNTEIKDYCSYNKVLNSTYVYIGDYVSYAMVSNGSVDVSIGDSSTQLAISAGIKVNVGMYNSIINLRGCSQMNIGNKCQDVFADTAINGNVGDNCSNIVMNLLNVTAKATYLNSSNFGSYNYKVSDSKVANYSNRTYLASNNPTNATEVLTPLAIYIGETTNYPVNNVVEDNCTNIAIVNSTNNIIKQGAYNIFIGCPSVTNYSLTFTSGIADPAGSTPAYTVPNITALATLGGINCNTNIFGAKSQDIKLQGANKSNNVFGDNVTDVTTVTGFAFTNNRILVDGNAVTLTAAYDKKVFDKSSPDDHRWETSIDNAGVLQTPTKLV